MGWFDFLFRRKDPLRRAAEQIDLDTGVLEQCPVCRDIVDKQRDDLLPMADDRAARLVAEGDALVRPFGGDLARLRKLLREVRKPCEFSCRCEAHD